MSEVRTSKDVGTVLRLIGSTERNNIASFYSNCIDRSYASFKDREMALMTIDTGNYCREVKDIFNDYSGFNYRRINASARDRWSYEKHGHIKDKERFDEISKSLKNAIDENQRSIGNVKVYRGVPLKYFEEYGVSSLDDLKGLEGGFLLDRGFVSTSLVEDDCYYKSENELGLDYNVEIEYLIPEEFEDGVSISSLSYSPNQTEYLINSWNLAQVVGVSMDADDGAVVQALLIPKHIYDMGYRHEKGTVK